MDNQIDYSSFDFDYDFSHSSEKERIVNDIEQMEEERQDILKDNSTETVVQVSVGLKPTREIIRGSVIYEQNGNNN